MSDKSFRYVSWLAYPLVTFTVVMLYFCLHGVLEPLWISANIPVIAGAVMVTMLEYRFPHYRQWRPQIPEVRNDLMYMAIVQMVLPKMLVFLFVIWLIDPLQQSGLMLPDYWPHHAPVWLQAILMILVADFLRYWLHVAAHKNRTLWRLHAVHHSPHRLYWLNVGRFHPLEKALQMLLDTLPFILLGVSPEVIALYFVFYAVNGFFQHSNIELRYGVLNYIVSSAELHRWHHSRIPEESNRNYGNNLIIWDLLFGTWFLPAGRKILDVGLNNRNYPQHFAGQLMAPFTPGAEGNDTGPQGMGRAWQRAVFWLRMKIVYLFQVQPLLQVADKPQRTQNKILKKILKANTATRFGTEHRFDDIKNSDDFARNVPLQDYESLRPYIEEQEARHTLALTGDYPVMYAVTSGTGSAPKYIPVTARAMKQFRSEQRVFAWVQYKLCPRAFSGAILGFVSPAIEGYRASGIPYGSVSGYFYKTMPRQIRRNYVVPPAVVDIEDYELKYKLILRLALAEPRITCLAGANPSSFLRLLEILNSSRDAFVESLETGEFRPIGTVDAPLRASLAACLKPCPARARELRALAGKEEITYADLWPDIRLLSVWTGGSCGIALGTLRQKLPQSTSIIELGYLSSEFRGTVTHDPVSGDGIPTFHHNYFEFIERDAWDRNEKQTVTLQQLETGKEYYIIVTTVSGLYRYFMNDIVRVTGRFRNTPVMRFVQKGKGATSITGEKMYEDHVLQALRKAEEVFHFTTLFMMTLADEEQACYRMYLEPGQSLPGRAAEIAEYIDQRLDDINIEYQNKRASGRLRPLSLNLLQAGAGEAYKAFRIAQGQREGQFKCITLQYLHAFPFDFSGHLSHSDH